MGAARIRSSYDDHDASDAASKTDPCSPLRAKPCEQQDDVRLHFHASHASRLDDSCDDAKTCASDAMMALRGDANQGLTRVRDDGVDPSNRVWCDDGACGA
jgi:hypothetical protein